MDERQPRILVVDDTPVNVKVLEATLAPRGYAIAGATSGAEALVHIIRHTRPISCCWTWSCPRWTGTRCAAVCVWTP
jgi:CheY-like chemotaxis protein